MMDDAGGHGAERHGRGASGTEGPEEASGRSPIELPVVVEFDLTPEEWVEVALQHNRGSPAYRDAVRRSQRSFAMVVVLIGLLGVLNSYDYFAVVFFLVGAVLTALVPRLVGRAQRKQYERIAREGIANGMFGTHRVELTPEGIVDDTPAYRRLTRWHAVERVAEAPGAFLLYMGNNAFLPIPHSAFRDSATLRAFADAFFERVGAERPGPTVREAEDTTETRLEGGTS